MEKILKFVELLQDFKAIKRNIVIAKENRAENDAEHSFQLALTAWYIISTQNLKFNLDLCVRYALVHDLVEVYAGDTPAVGVKHQDARNSKKEREEKARAKLQKEFPELTEIYELIDSYELRIDEESKFVYALDKILPIMNIYLDKGYSWKTQKITFKEIMDIKVGKVSVSPEIEKYFSLMMDRLKREEKTLFGN